MSVVVRMEMPKRCYECDMADGLTCMATGGVYGRDVPKMTWIKRRPDWCPIICQLPEGHGRLIDADKIDYYEVERFGEPHYMVWKPHIDGLPTIVPAEK